MARMAGESSTFVQDFMGAFEKDTSWGNAMPALTGKEIGGNETDLTEAKVWGKGEIAQAYTTFNSCSFPKQIMASIHALGFAAPSRSPAATSSASPRLAAARR